VAVGEVAVAKAVEKAAAMDVVAVEATAATTAATAEVMAKAHIHSLYIPKN
jgi:hypothetical protein